MITCHSQEETIQLGRKLGEKLAPNSVVCFFGELGAGKTTCIKGVVESATKKLDHCVNSPTFVYLNIYEGPVPVFHFDLYRLKDADEFLSMGFDEYFSAGGICCVEWSEKIAALLPPDCIMIEMHHAKENSRLVKIKSETFDEKDLI